jgi:site-specific DNA recombinase
MWMADTIPLGYDVKNRKLVINEEKAECVPMILRQYLAAGNVLRLKATREKKKDSQ